MVLVIRVNFRAAVASRLTGWGGTAVPECTKSRTERAIEPSTFPCSFSLLSPIKNTFSRVCNHLSVCEDYGDYNQAVEDRKKEFGRLGMRT